MSSTAYDQMLRQAVHSREQFHGNMDHNNYEAQRTLQKMKEFEGLIRSHSDPTHISAKARDISEQFHHLQHMPDSSGHRPISTGQASEFHHHYRDFYDVNRWKHHF